MCSRLLDGVHAAGAGNNRGTPSAISTDHQAHKLDLEEAVIVIEEAATAIAEVELASALPEDALNELQSCGLGYLEDARDTPSGKSSQDPQILALESSTKDALTSSYNEQVLPSERREPAALSEVAPGTTEAAQPESDRVEAFTVFEDRRPSTGEDSNTLRSESHFWIVISFIVTMSCFWRKKHIRSGQTYEISALKPCVKTCMQF